MIPASVRIFVCREPQDLRRSFDGLALAAQERLGEDPRSGALFCFVNRRFNRLKILWWDRNGYCLLYKRLHRALFCIPRGEPLSARAIRLSGPELAELIAGVARERRRQPKVSIAS
jgi:transposase